MKTMMRKASIVLLLLGLAVKADDFPKLGPSKKISDFKYKYIVTPKAMDSEAEKNSVLHRFKEVQKKLSEKIVEAAGLYKKVEEAHEKMNEKEAEVAKARDATQQKIDDEEAKLTQVTTEHKDAETACGEEKKKKKPSDAAEGWDDQHAKDVKEKEDAVAVLLKDKVDLKANIDELKKLKAECDKNWTPTDDEGKDGWNNDWDSIDAKDEKAKDKVAKLKPWAKQLYELKVAMTKAEAAYKKVEEGQRDYEMDGDNPKEVKGEKVPKTPEAGGLAYWNDEMTAVTDKVTGSMDKYSFLGPKAANDLPNDLSKNALSKDIELLGFFGDVHGNQLLIGSDKLDLGDVQKLFEDKIKATSGHKEETYKIADVEEAKKDAVPTMSVNNLVKITEGAPDHKDHGGVIGAMGALIETVSMQRKKYKDDAGKEEDGKEDYVKKYLNMQAAGAIIYIGYTPEFNMAHRPHDFSLGGKLMGIPMPTTDDPKFPADPMLLERQSNHWELAGDLTDMSGAKLGCSGSSKGKDGGSNTWMIVAIIFIVIVVLGGLVLGYQAYNASGSLQNTDI